MKKLLLTIVLVLSAFTSLAADLPAADAQLIEKAGIPIFEHAVFAYGNQSVGFRFATDAPPEEVRHWYQQKLGSWTLYDQYGSWILYNGKPGLGMGEIMTCDQVSIQTNTNLPAWHSLAGDMTTEIVIMIFP